MGAPFAAGPNIPMLDELALKAAEPDKEVVKALQALVMGIPARNDEMVAGHVQAFLMEHPEIAKAYTAQKLLERVAHGFTGFIKDVADYLIPIQRKRGKGART